MVDVERVELSMPKRLIYSQVGLPVFLHIHIILEIKGQESTAVAEAKAVLKSLMDVGYTRVKSFMCTSFSKGAISGHSLLNIIYLHAVR